MKTRHIDLLGVRHLLAEGPVGVLGLHEDHGVGVADRREQQGPRVARPAGRDDLRARQVGVGGLAALAVVLQGAHAAAEGHADHQRHGELAVGAEQKIGLRADGLADLLEGLLFAHGQQSDSRRVTPGLASRFMQQITD